MSGSPPPDDRELAMHRCFEQQVFDDLDRGFREPVPRPEPSSHQPAAVDMQAASSSWRNWASAGWLATCLCIALLFGWRAAGHSGSLAQSVRLISEWADITLAAVEREPMTWPRRMNASPHSAPVWSNCSAGCTGRGRNDTCGI